MKVFIMFNYHPAIENEKAGPGNKKENPTNTDNDITNEDDDIVNNDNVDPVISSEEEIPSDIDKKNLVEADAAPSEEDLHEADNNYRDALNDDSLETPKKVGTLLKNSFICLFR